MADKTMWDNLIKLIVFVLMIPIFLMIYGCVSNLIFKPVDEITKNNFNSIGDEIRYQAKEPMPRTVDLPIQIKKGYIIKAYNEDENNPSKCGKNPCLCLFATDQSAAPKLCHRIIIQGKTVELDIPAQEAVIFPDPEIGNPGFDKITAMLIEMYEENRIIHIKLTHRKVEEKEE